jgi:hypothetical protein
MKIQTTLIVVLLVIIATLSIYAGYLHHEKNRILKAANQFIVAYTVHTYQSLDRGDVEQVKQGMGKFVVAHSSEYEQMYGSEADTKFASVLEDAKVIRDKIASK